MFPVFSFKNRSLFFAPLVFFVIVAAVSLCFSSCASSAAGRAANEQTRPHVYLTNRARFFLLSPADIESPIDMAQLVSASYGGRDYLLNAWVKADKTGIDMALFNELGAAMGELSYREGAVSFSSSVFPSSLKGEYIVADFELCFYNETFLRRGLEDAGLALESSGTGRRVLDGKKVIVEIEKTSNSVSFKNHLRGYSYTLEGDFK